MSPVGEIRRVFNALDGSVLYLAEATYRGDDIRLEMDLIPAASTAAPREIERSR